MVLESFGGPLINKDVRKSRFSLFKKEREEPLIPVDQQANLPS
jgi:hypothetical protein